MNFFDLSLDEQFDVIIGNPPYVRWRNQPQKTREDIIKRKFWNNRLNTLADLMQAFIFKSVEHLKLNGELIFLTPKFWLETLHASNLRKYILEHGYLDFIIDFNEKKIFTSVSSNLIVFRFVNAPIPPRHELRLFTFQKKGEVSKFELEFILEILKDPSKAQEDKESAYMIYQIVQHPCTSESWKFFSKKEIKFINTFEKSCMAHYEVMVKKINGIDGYDDKIPLVKCFTNEQLKRFDTDPKIRNYGFFENKKIFFVPDFMKDHRLLDNSRFVTITDVFIVGNGMVSGLDKAFWLAKNTINKKLHLLFTRKELSFIRKVVKARFMNQYYCEKYAEYIFIEEEDFKDELDFQKECPNLYAVLVPFKDDLLRRWSVKPVPWYVWSFPRNFGIFKNFTHKYFLPCKERFDNKGYIRCVYDSHPVLGVQDVTVLGLYNWVKESPEYLLAYLNSEVLFNWLMIKGLKRGGVLQFSEHPLSTMPIRLINWHDQIEVEIHNTITNQIQQLLQEKNLEQIKKYTESINKFMNKLLLN